MTTQPRPRAVDTAPMVIAPVGFRQMQIDFEAAIFLGELRLAAGQRIDAFPAEFEAIATAFFSICRPRATA